MDKISLKSKYIEKIILSVFMCLPLLTIAIYLDNDSWFLINHGRYVAEHGFPNFEPFTIHNNLEFVMQQWLFSWLYWLVYSNLGKWAIIASMYVAGFIIIFLIYKLCMLISNNEFYLSILLTVVISLPICLWFVVSRPQVVTYIMILSELLCLEKYINSSKSRYLCVLPIISILQINLHASMWMLIFAFLLPYVVEVLVKKSEERKHKKCKTYSLILTGAIMFVVGFLNPYGAKSVFYIVDSYGNSVIDNSVAEMAAPIVRDIHGLIFFIYVAGFIVVYLINRKQRTKMRYIFLFLGTIFLGLLSLKSMPYFLMGAGIPLAYCLKSQAHNLKFSVENKKKNTIRNVGCIVFLVMTIGAVVYANIKDYDTKKDYPDSSEAISFLKEDASTDDVILYVDYFNGGYAEYMGYRTYIDARAEVFLKDNNGVKDIFQEYISLQRGELHYQDFLDRYKFTHILVTESDILSVYLEKDTEYKAIYKDKKCKIYVSNNKHGG